MAKTLFVVQGQGFGDLEDAFYNVKAFSTLAKANKYVAQLEINDAAEDVCFTYNIETLELA